MSISGCFGWGAEKIIAQNNITDGTITKVKTCWWLKVNTKHARLHALDGACFPHIIYFTYQVKGTEYKGSRYVSWYVSYAAGCPRAGEKITVFYDGDHPARYAARVLPQARSEENL